MARDKILRDMVGAVLSDDSSYGVLVVDEHGLRVLNAVCKTYHLNKQNVAVVENIHLARQPLPKFKGIYLVAPTEAAVEQVVRDFVGGPRPLYESAHIFFLSSTLVRACARACPLQCSHARACVAMRSAVCARGRRDP
jgi:hypothetical protein